MELNLQKEKFSDAYVCAVAAVAGFTCDKPQTDIDSVDWCIATVGGKGTIRSPKLDLQLKCTSHDSRQGDCIRYPLKIKNYNDLRADNYQVPRILVVVVVPEEVKDWLTQTEQALAMRHCGYCVSLCGKPETENASTVTVELPRARCFTVEELKAMMARIGNGGQP
jgi:hypothetical protein